MTKEERHEAIKAAVARFRSDGVYTPSGNDGVVHFQDLVMQQTTEELAEFEAGLDSGERDDFLWAAVQTLSMDTFSMIVSMAASRMARAEVEHATGELEKALEVIDELKRKRDLWKEQAQDRESRLSTQSKEVRMLKDSLKELQDWYDQKFVEVIRLKIDLGVGLDDDERRRVNEALNSSS